MQRRGGQGQEQAGLHTTAYTARIRVHADLLGDRTSGFKREVREGVSLAVNQNARVAYCAERNGWLMFTLIGK